MVYTFQIFFATLLAIIPGQFSLGVHPDVTFGDQNDRFDIGDIIHDQDQREGEEFRRSIEDQAKLLATDGDIQESATVKMAESLENIFKEPTKQDIGFSVKVIGNPEGTDDDFEKSFKVFKSNAKKIEDDYKKESNRRNDIMKYLHGGSRRANENANTDAEILLHYAIPVVLQIQGYVQPPLD